MRVLVYEAKGCRFKSCQAVHLTLANGENMEPDDNEVWEGDYGDQNAGCEGDPE